MPRIMSTGDELPLSGVTIGSFSLGWDTLNVDGLASALLLNDQGKVPDTRYFLYSEGLQTPDGTVEHSGDGVEEDAIINVRLPDVPAEIHRIVFVVSAAGADEHARLGTVFLRVTDERRAELARYEPADDILPATVMVVGELQRDGAEWKFRAQGEVYPSSLGRFAESFGVRL